jgi:pimeloyl-ACP methyl ester carboxylesterase
MMSLAWVLGVSLAFFVGCILFTAAYATYVRLAYPPTGSFVELGGGRLHYRERRGAAGAEAGTVVLLHGLCSNLEEVMLGIGSHLPEQYRVIAFDRPGYGWSDRIGGRSAGTPARQAAIIADAMRRLGLRNALIVGHSWSGAVVAALALDHRDVTGAILDLAGATHPWPLGLAGERNRWVANWRGWVFSRTIGVPLIRLWLWMGMKASFAPQDVPPDFARLARLPLLFRPSVFYANLQDSAMLNESLAIQSRRYGEIRVPTTVIAGEMDTIVTPAFNAPIFADAVAGAKLILLPGIGHMVQYAAPAIVVREIEALAAGLRANEAA